MFTTKRKILLARISVVLFIFLAGFGFTLTAKAEEGYYATWKEYKASGAPSATWDDVANAMDNVFERAKELYKAGDSKGAYDSVNHGYYGYYETTGFERNTLAKISGARKSEVELQFAACKAITKNGGSTDEFDKEVDKLKSMIRNDAALLDGKKPKVSGKGDVKAGSADETTVRQIVEEVLAEQSGGSTSAATATFIACFSIILREGFEAILIVGAIIAYLVKSAANDKERKKKLTRPVYVGSLVGVVASFALAWLLDVLTLANSASQEIIEGVTALTAVVVLYYVSNWMLSKSESDSWTNYIKSKTESSAKTGSTMALALTAFLAVFREGAEVVLFFQPMLKDENISMVWAGLIVGFIVLIFVYYAINAFSVKIPLRPFFTATSILMFIMSISFLGAGIKELIEGDVIVMTSPEWLAALIPATEFLDVLGIYPILETLIPQLILLAITVVIYLHWKKKNLAVRKEADKRRAEEAAKKEALAKQEEENRLRELIKSVVKEVMQEKAAN
nr:FTR1 family protein [uncultured Catonella sp.]